MELRYLYEFSKLAKSHSFSVAAEELFISQSSLSKHIMSMENELGVPLFERTTRNVSLSNYGKLLLTYSEAVSEQYAEFCTCLKTMTDGHRNNLALYSIPVMAHYGIAEAIGDFHGVFPDINVSVEEREGRDIPGHLESGDCELAFERFTEMNNDELEYLPYCSDELVAVLPDTHPLAAMAEISLTELSDEVFLLLDENTMVYPICMSACEREGFAPKMAYKGHRPENIIELVAKGMGISLLMRKQPEFYKNPGISIVCLRPRVTSYICLVKRKDRTLSASARAFWSFIEETAVV